MLITPSADPSQGAIGSVLGAVKLLDVYSAATAPIFAAAAAGLFAAVARVTLCRWRGLTAVANSSPEASMVVSFKV